MSYFRAHSHCRFVTGSTWGALFDLFQGRVFWISDPLGMALLQSSEQNVGFEDVANHTGRSVAAVEKYARNLQNLDWGLVQAAPFFTERYCPTVLSVHERKLAYHRVLRQATIEISGACTLNCPICGFYNGFATSLCACGCWPEGKDEVTFDPAALIEQLAAYGCDRVQLFGGDPCLSREPLAVILAECSRLRIPVILHTSGLTLNPGDWRRLAQCEATVVLPIFGANPVDCARATGVADAYQRLLLSVEMARREGVNNVMATVVLTTGGMERLAEIEQWLAGLSIPLFGHVTYLPFSAAAGDFDEKEHATSHALLRKKPAHYVTSLETFLRSTKGHWCWQDTIAITRAGDIVPCIAARNHVIANVNNESILDVLREKKHGMFRDASRDTFDSCSACEFRFGCNECSVMTERIRNTWESRAWDCVYDPETGEW